MGDVTPGIWGTPAFFSRQPSRWRRFQPYASLSSKKLCAVGVPSCVAGSGVCVCQECTRNILPACSSCRGSPTGCMPHRRRLHPATAPLHAHAAAAAAAPHLRRVCAIQGRRDGDAAPEGALHHLICSANGQRKHLVATCANYRAVVQAVGTWPHVRCPWCAQGRALLWPRVPPSTAPTRRAHCSWGEVAPTHQRASSRWPAGSAGRPPAPPPGRARGRGCCEREERGAGRHPANGYHTGGDCVPLLGHWMAPWLL